MSTPRSEYVWLVLVCCLVLAWFAWPDTTKVQQTRVDIAPEPAPAGPRMYVLVHSIEGCGACSRWINEEAPKVRELTMAKIEKRTHEKPEPGKMYPWIEIWDKAGDRHEWNYSRRDPWLTAKECADILCKVESR